VVAERAVAGFGRGKKGRAAEDLRFRTVRGLVRVAEVAADGIFALSGIKAGDICLSVDSVPAADADVAARALGRSLSIVALLVFSVRALWKRVVELVVGERYGRWWKSDSVCVLIPSSGEAGASVVLFFKNDDHDDGAATTPCHCTAEGNEADEVDVARINMIINRVMDLLAKSVRATMKNCSDVYRRALMKQAETRKNQTLSKSDDNSRQVALSTAK